MIFDRNNYNNTVIQAYKALVVKNYKLQLRIEAGACNKHLEVLGELYVIAI